MKKQNLLSGSLLGAFPKMRTATLGFAVSVLLSTWSNSAPTEMIFMEIDLWGFDIFLTVHHSIDFFQLPTQCTLPLCYNNIQYAGGERTAVRSPPAYCTAVYRGWRYQRLWWYSLSSWGWAACCSKHVEECSVTYILLKNKRIVHYVGNLKKSAVCACVCARTRTRVWTSTIGRNA